MNDSVKLRRNKATTFLADGHPAAIFDLQHTFVFSNKTAPLDGILAIRTEGKHAISEISVAKFLQKKRSDEESDEEQEANLMYKTVSSVAIDEPDLVYTHLLQLSQCYEAMAKNNKLVVFTDDMSVRKAFYGLIYNSTRTGLVADSKTLNITGVLSVTDFIMVLMMLWKFRENIDEMRGTPLSHQEFNCMDVANMRINKWKELLKVQGNLRPFVSISTNESIFRAVELLTKHRIHRLPVMDRKTNDCAYILTHRRILHYIWKHCSMLPRPNYMYEPVFDLKVGTYTGIQYATEDMTLLEALDLLIDNGISGLPIVERDTMKIVEIYTRFDAVSVAFCKAIDMSISVGEAIRQREQICGGRDGLVTAPENVSMWELVELFVEKNVHRVFLINSNHLLKGLVSLSDLINYMVLRPAHTKQNSTLNVC